MKRIDRATGNDRPRPDGREHGAPAAARRAPMRGVRHVREGGRRAGRRRTPSARPRWPNSSTSSTKPRAVWLMVPAGVGRQDASPICCRMLERGDILIDGGNSYYIDDIRRAKELAPKGIHYVDVGTSGGVWGLERGYCMMIGGEAEVGEAPRPDLRHPRARAAATSRARRDARRPAAPPSRAICIAGPAARAISSRWCTTASNTA